MEEETVRRIVVLNLFGEMRPARAPLDRRASEREARTRDREVLHGLPDDRDAERTKIELLVARPLAGLR